MLEYEGQDDHLLVTIWALEELALQPPKGFGQLHEGCVVAQGPWLTLDHRQIMPRIIDRAPRQMVRSLYNPRVLAQNLPLCGDEDPLGVDAQAHRTAGKDVGTL